MTDGLIAWLKAQPTITAIVGDRIYPNAAPQNIRTSTAPYVLVSVVAREDGRHSRGFSGLTRSTFLLDCFAGRYSEAQGAFYEALAALFSNGYRGLMGTWNVKGAWTEDVRDEYIQRGQLTEDNTHEAPIALVIWYDSNLAA